ncbi:MAG TPA: hypothetical protein VF131_17475 [Blastocatellia bacterium]|nr:hypothetical protein [Blastocatellia bacterium]
MVPVYCEHCNRANGADAPRCIWCGLPVTGASLGGDFEITRIEIEYLGGIDRLDDPAPVKLAVGPAGVEITEIIPGSRNVKIAAHEILDAQVEDASTFIEGKRKRAAWWWYLIRPLGSDAPDRKPADTKKHDYILTIIYKAEGDVKKAAFRREDRLGLSLLNGVARIIALLVRRNQQ